MFVSQFHYCFMSSISAKIQSQIVEQDKGTGLLQLKHVKVAKELLKLESKLKYKRL